MSGLKRPPPFSLRLTFEERARLEREAGDEPLGSYIRSRVFDETKPPPRRRGKRPVKDHKALAKLFAMLGAGRIASNLNQLAKAANSGSLVMDADTERLLKETLRAIIWMRVKLMQALGLYESEDA